MVSSDRGMLGSPAERADRPNYTRPRRRNTHLMSPTLNAFGNDARGTAVIEAAPKGHQSAGTEIVCPSIFSRIIARLRARPLDRLVEAGASPQPGSALEAHMVRLGTIGHRESLAAELRCRATALLCDQVMSLPPGRVDVQAVWEAADLIDRVEKRLLNHHGVSPRGTARLRRLLADWSGPLRRHGSGSLSAELRAVLTAL